MPRPSNLSSDSSVVIRLIVLTLMFLVSLRSSLDRFVCANELIDVITINVNATRDLAAVLTLTVLFIFVSPNMIKSVLP